MQVIVTAWGKFIDVVLFKINCWYYETEKKNNQCMLISCSISNFTLAITVCFTFCLKSIRRLDCLELIKCLNESS